MKDNRSNVEIAEDFVKFMDELTERIKKEKERITKDKR